VTTGGGKYALESWDGRDVYYTRMRSTPGIWRIPTGGGEETQVLLEPGLGWRGLSVSRSGLYYFRRLAERAEDTSSTEGRGAGYAVDFLDLESGQVVRVFEDDDFYPWVDLAVSPDDRWILTVKRPLPVSELMLMENFR